MRKRLIHWLGLTGVVALLSYTAAVVFSPLAYPDYNWMAQAVSDLSAEAAAIRDWDNATDEQLADSDKLPHWELAKKYNLIDFDLGVKISGAGFPVYVGLGARLQRALINFFLAEASKAGYTEIMPPTVVNEATTL